MVENDYIAQIQEEGIVNVVMGAVGGTTDNADPNSVSPGTILMDALELSRQILSVNTVWMFIGACAILLALILVTNIKQIWVGLNKVGITILVAGALFLLPTILIWNQPADWLQGPATMQMAGKLVREIIIMTAPVCIIATAIGVVLLVTGIVTYCTVRAKYRKTMKAMSAPVAQPVAPVASPTIDEILSNLEPVEETPVEETPIEEAPIEEAPVEETPVEEAPVEEAPVEEAPVEEAHVEEAPVEEAPVEEPVAAEATE